MATCVGTFNLCFYHKHYPRHPNCKTSWNNWIYKLSLFFHQDCEYVCLFAINRTWSCRFLSTKIYFVTSSIEDICGCWFFFVEMAVLQLAVRVVTATLVYWLLTPALKPVSVEAGVRLSASLWQLGMAGVVLLHSALGAGQKRCLRATTVSCCERECVD